MIFDQIAETNAEADANPTRLRLSLDAKAGVIIGNFSRGGGHSRVHVQAADHDFQPDAKLTPFGILVPHTGEVFLYLTPCKYNPIERVWGVLEQHWNGSLLDCIETVVRFAQSMTFRGIHPAVQLSDRLYHTGVKLTQQQMARLETRFERHAQLGKWFVRIAPRLC